jgi:hypothetical protein
MSENSSLTSGKIAYWFLSPVIGSIWFVILTTIGMILYPGGTFLDSTIHGYSFFMNYFSDIGRTVARIGGSNFSASICFTMATIGMGLLAMPYFFLIPCFFAYTDKLLASKLAKIARVFGILSCLFYMGVGLAPSNTMRFYHYLFLFLGMAGVLMISLLLAKVFLISKVFAPLYVKVCVIFAVLISVYAFVIIFIPDTTLIGLYFNVVGQKIVVYSEMIMMVILGIGAYKKAKKHIPN